MNISLQHKRHEGLTTLKFVAGAGATYSLIADYIICTI